MSPEKYDLIVIGSGPAGEKGAGQAADFGTRGALVETTLLLGGAAAHAGTPERCPAFPIQADCSLLATGSYPYRPPEFPFHDPRVYDSDTILALHEIPRTLLVVGGGVIGCEYACTFAALGVEVTVVEKR